MNSVLWKAFIGFCVLGVIVASFYGGRLYQNNVDQTLFVAYYPPTPGPSANAFGGGGGGLGAGGSLVGAALSAGLPPSAQAAAATPSPSSAAAGAAPGATSGTPAVTASGGAAARLITGQLVSIAPTSLVLRLPSGQTSSFPIAAGQTAFYRASTTTAQTLVAGDQVTAAVSRAAGQFTLTSLTIGPAGPEYAYVQAPSTSGASAPGAAGEFGPRALAGNVVSVSGSSLGLMTNRGFATTLALPFGLAVYRIAPVQTSALTAGTEVSVRWAASHTVLSEVVASPSATLNAWLAVPAVRQPGANTQGG